MPSITTSVPPVVVPSAGVILVMVGGVTYVNPSPAPELPVPPTSVTLTASSPADPAAVFARISVSDFTSTLVAAAPIVTVEVFKKPVPLIFTAAVPGGTRGGAYGRFDFGDGGRRDIREFSRFAGLAEFVADRDLGLARGPRGSLAVSSVAETTVTLVASVPPTSTVMVFSSRTRCL